VLPEDPHVRAYLVDAGLADTIPGRGMRGQASAARPLIRLTRISTPEEWDDLIPDLLPAAHAALGIPTRTASVLILSELIDNAATTARVELARSSATAVHRCE